MWALLLCPIVPHMAPFTVGRSAEHRASPAMPLPATRPHQRPNPMAYPPAHQPCTRARRTQRCITFALRRQVGSSPNHTSRGSTRITVTFSAPSCYRRGPTHIRGFSTHAVPCTCNAKARARLACRLVFVAKCAASPTIGLRRLARPVHDGPSLLCQLTYRQASLRENASFVRRRRRPASSGTSSDSDRLAATNLPLHAAGLRQW